MSPKLKQLEHDLLELPRSEREALAGALYNSLEEHPVNEHDAAWIEEAERRYRDWKAGRSPGVPAEQVHRELRQEMGWD